jgi:hypothetical protein
MKATLINIQTTIMIDEDQVDICYNYPTTELTIFINGIEVTHYNFSPTRAVYTTMNMITIAVEVTSKWRAKVKQESKGIDS